MIMSVFIDKQSQYCVAFVISRSYVLHAW